MTSGRKNLARTAGLERRRLEAAEMFAQGARTIDVARAFGVAWRTAHKWRKVLTATGVDGLRSRGTPGRKPLLDSNQRRRLRRILEAGARHAGFAADSWTLARIQTVVDRVFGVQCSRVSIWRIVRRWPNSVTISSRQRTASANPAPSPVDPASCDDASVS